VLSVRPVLLKEVAPADRVVTVEYEPLPAGLRRSTVYPVSFVALSVQARLICVVLVAVAVSEVGAAGTLRVVTPPVAFWLAAVLELSPTPL
jgi:hypothetical protein